MIKKLAVLFLGVAIGWIANGRDWSEWLRQIETGRSRQIGNHMAFEKLSWGAAWDWQMRAREDGYFAALHDNGIKPDLAKLYATTEEQLHAAKRMAGYE